MKTDNKTWKPVTIGGFTGILMGAGAMHYAQGKNSEVNIAEDVQMAEFQSNEDISFRDAFNTARSEMGPGAVFRWHGNLYNTYTAEEWQAMEENEKESFAQEVSPEVSPEDIDTDELVASEEVSPVKEQEANTDSADADVQVNVEATEEMTLAATDNNQVQSDDDDVRVVGFGEVRLDNGRDITVQELDVNGQRVAVIDIDQDGKADIAMSDLNQNQQMDEGEVIDLHTGEALSFTNDDGTVDDILPDTLGL